MAIDPDAGETFAYAVGGGADQPKFSIGGAGGDELIISDGLLDFEEWPRNPFAEPLKNHLPQQRIVLQATHKR